MEGKDREIIARYGEDMLRFVSRTVRCREDAEEVVQDVFVRALRSLSQYDERRASMRTWLTRIAYNEVMRYHEQRKNEPTLVPLHELCDDTAETSDNDRRRDMLEWAIRRLSKDERLLLSMRYADGLSIRDMAFITGIKEQNLPVRMQRIRERLKIIIKELGYERLH